MAEKNVTFIDAKIDAKSPFTRNNLDYYNKVRKLLKEQHFDLVHCHTPIVGLIVRWAARGYRKKVLKLFILLMDWLLLICLLGKNTWYIISLSLLRHDFVMQ